MSDAFKAPIVILKPWTRQPPAGTPIDWSNPLARGLCFFAPADQFGTDAVSGERPKVSGSPSNTRITQMIFADKPQISGWVFDTKGTSEGSSNGWYFGDGIKDGTFPRGFKAKADGADGVTTMSWAQWDNKSVQWTALFGVMWGGTPHYQGALTRSAATDQFNMDWSDGTAEDQFDTGSSPIGAVGEMHQYVTTLKNTGSATRATLR